MGQSPHKGPSLTRDAWPLWVMGNDVIYTTLYSGNGVIYTTLYRVMVSSTPRCIGVMMSSTPRCIGVMVSSTPRCIGVMVSSTPRCIGVMVSSTTVHVYLLGHWCQRNFKTDCHTVFNGRIPTHHVYSSCLWFNSLMCVRTCFVHFVYALTIADI